MLVFNDELRDAACKSLSERGKAEFFAHTNNVKAINRSKQICRGCSVRPACLEDVLSFEIPGEREGVWGGLSAAERDELFGGAVDDVQAS